MRRGRVARGKRRRVTRPASVAGLLPSFRLQDPVPPNVRTFFTPNTPLGKFPNPIDNVQVRATSFVVFCLAVVTATGVFGFDNLDFFAIIPVILGDFVLRTVRARRPRASRRPQSSDGSHDSRRPLAWCRSRRSR